MIENTYMITRYTPDGSILFHCLYRGAVKGALNLAGATKSFQVITANETDGILNYGLYRVREATSLILRVHNANNN
jgi:hypothetical protein